MNANLEQLELRWLARQTKPMWGAHISRGEPITDPNLQRWIDTGLVELTECGSGYRLSERGHAYIKRTDNG